jgi:Bacterial Ig-like domain
LPTRAVAASRSASPQPPAVVDTVAPFVRSVSPVPGSRSVAASANVVAVFSEPIDARTLTSATVTLATRSGSVPATVRYDAAHRRVVLDPRGRLAAGTQYTATIRAGVRDAAGVPLAKTMSWKFTVRRGVIL